MGRGRDVSPGQVVEVPFGRHNGYVHGMRMHRLIGLLLWCCLLAGCGSGGTQTSSQSRPLIPTGVGALLAARADALATTLDGGDPCAAVPAAQQLQQAVGAAVAAGQVPAALRAQLLDATASLTTSVKCPPPAPSKKPEPPKKDDHGHPHQHHHGNDQGGDGGG